MAGDRAPSGDIADELAAELDRLGDMFRGARNVPEAFDMDVVLDRAQAALETVRLVDELHQPSGRDCRACRFQWPCATARLITRQIIGGTDGR